MKKREPLSQELGKESCADKTLGFVMDKEGPHHQPMRKWKPREAGTCAHSRWGREVQNSKLSPGMQSTPLSRPLPF